MKTAVILAYSVLSFLQSSLLADVDVEFVTVGDPGNPHDTSHLSSGIHGGVPYSYRIGKFEVTNGQYVQFLNSADPNGLNELSLFDSRMSSESPGGIILDSSRPPHEKFSVKSGRGEQPVIYLTWFDALRFTNWLNNGQGHGDTETGAYTFGPLGDDAVPLNIELIERNSDAEFFLPSVDEWHKAAYYQPPEDGGDPQGYWDYPMQTNAEPFSAAPPGSSSPDASRAGNFEKDDGVDNGYDNGPALPVLPGESPLTDVGAYVYATSYYGAHDLGGNVWEMTDTFSEGFPNVFHIQMRGGSWSGPFGLIRAGSHGSFGHGATGANRGFRVASVIPEPDTLLVTILATSAILFRQRR